MARDETAERRKVKVKTAGKGDWGFADPHDRQVGRDRAKCPKKAK